MKIFIIVWSLSRNCTDNTSSRTRTIHKPQREHSKRWPLRKMRKTLSSWKTRVKEVILEDNKTWEELKEKESMIDEPSYNLFKDRCESEAAKAASAKGKAMLAHVIGNH